MRAIDRHARKQVLLARIAFDRIELQRDLLRVRQSVGVARLLHELLTRAPQVAGWFDARLLRGRGGWRRVLRLALLGVAAWAGWRATPPAAPAPPADRSTEPAAR